MKQKRLKFAIIISIINLSIFCVGMYKGTDLISIGTGLSLINAPLYAYILGETMRKSENKK